MLSTAVRKAVGDIQAGAEANVFEVGLETGEMPADGNRIELIYCT